MFNFDQNTMLHEHHLIHHYSFTTIKHKFIGMRKTLDTNIFGVKILSFIVLFDALFLYRLVFILSIDDRAEKQVIANILVVKISSIQGFYLNLWIKSV